MWLNKLLKKNPLRAVKDTSRCGIKAVPTCLPLTLCTLAGTHLASLLGASFSLNNHLVICLVCLAIRSLRSGFFLLLFCFVLVLCILCFSSNEAYFSEEQIT